MFHPLRLRESKKTKYALWIEKIVLMQSNAIWMYLIFGNDANYLVVLDASKYELQN